MRRDAFRAQIGANHKHFYIGTYATAREAAIAYDLAAIEYHGEFARTNILSANEPLPEPPQRIFLGDRVRRGKTPGHRGKLNAEQVKAIRRVYTKASTTYDTLAAKYGVSRATIINVVKGKMYKWVE